jgi:hypothetical protein
MSASEIKYQYFYQLHKFISHSPWENNSQTVKRQKKSFMEPEESSVTASAGLSAIQQMNEPLSRSVWKQSGLVSHKSCIY